MGKDLKEERLMRMMAWRNIHNLDFRKPNSAKDAQDNAIAVKMLTCVGCIDYIMLYIKDDLVQEGKYRHDIKRAHGLYSFDAAKAHDLAYTLLKDTNPVASRMYNDYVDYYFGLIWDCVYLEGIEKTMNILYSLSRLVEKYDEKIRGRYDFAPSKRLFGARGRFCNVNVKDYSLDFLIESVINKKMDIKN